VVRSPAAASRLPWLVAAGAFALGVVRAAGLPMTSDAAYHLVRGGNSLLRFSLDAWALPPGGVHAPPLGSLVTAILALFSSDPEGKILLAGGVLLGGAAAVVGAALTRRAGGLVALAGVAWVLLPPFFASSFNYRPDSALAGGLVALGIAARAAGAGGGKASAPAWAGVWSSPWTLAPALALLLGDARARRDPRAWIVPGIVAAGMVALSLPLPAAAGGEILRGVFGEVGLPFRALPSTLGALREVWLGGVLLAVPLLLSLRFVDRSVLLPWLALFLPPLLLGRDEAFRGATAAIVPSTAFVIGLVVHRLPDGAGSAAGPRRPALLALLLPVLLLALQGGADRARRDEVRRTTARDSQLGAWLWSRLDTDGPLLAARTGALGGLTDRPVVPLVDGDELGPPWPAAVVLGGGVSPASRAERELLADPRFLAAYAPWEMSRPGSGDDAVWRRVRRPGGTVPAEYARSVADGLSALPADPDQARDRLGEAAAREPDSLGLARERWGVLLERAGRGREARAPLLAALADPWTLRARGHLADRALSRGDIPRADTLIARMYELAPDLAAVPGTRARLFALTDYGDLALVESERAVTLAPTDPRVLVNHGTLLWAAGRPDAARELWHRARHLDPGVGAYLGDFDAAPDSMVAPPLVPLFSRTGFLVPEPPPPSGAEEALPGTGE
jgi:hypothetical protein